MKINKSDVGRWITVKWDDSGRVDSLLVSVEDNYVKVYEPITRTLSNPSKDQITEKRGYCNAN